MRLWSRRACLRRPRDLLKKILWNPPSLQKQIILCLNRLFDDKILIQASYEPRACEEVFHSSFCVRNNKTDIAPRVMPVFDYAQVKSAFHSPNLLWGWGHAEERDPFVKQQESFCF